MYLQDHNNQSIKEKQQRIASSPMANSCEEATAVGGEWRDGSGRRQHARMYLCLLERWTDDEGRVIAAAAGPWAPTSSTIPATILVGESWVRVRGAPGVQWWLCND